MAGLIGQIEYNEGYAGTYAESELNPWTSYIASTLDGTAGDSAEDANIVTEGSMRFTVDQTFAAERMAWGDEWGDGAGYAIDVAAGGMLAASTYLFLYGDIFDDEQMNLAEALSGVSDDLFNVDWEWCNAVTSVYYWRCDDNDGLIPTSSQNLGRGFDEHDDYSPVVHVNEAQVGATYVSTIFHKYFDM